MAGFQKRAQQVCLLLTFYYNGETGGFRTSIRGAIHSNPRPCQETLANVRGIQAVSSRLLHRLHILSMVVLRVQSSSPRAIQQAGATPKKNYRMP